MICSAFRLEHFFYIGLQRNTKRDAEFVYQKT